MMEKETSKPLKEKESVDGEFNEIFFVEDVKQAVEEAYDEINERLFMLLHVNNQDIVKNIFKDKFGFKLE